MGLSHEHTVPKVLAKIQIYILTTAELLFTLCSEIPCSPGAKEEALITGDITEHDKVLLITIIHEGVFS